MADTYGDLGGWIETYSGQRIDILLPNPRVIETEDIARSLSMQSRYTGHTKHFYSVAQHSVLLAKHALACIDGEAKALALLLHDAHEFVVGDVSSPLKQLMPEFRKIDDLWTLAIRDRYGLSHDEDLWKYVKNLDIRILLKEREVLLPHTGEHDWCLGQWEPLDVEIELWTPERAEQEFMDLYWHLTGVLSSA